MRVAVSVPLYPTITDPPSPASRVGAWLSTHECMIAMVEAGHTVDVVPSMTPRSPTYVIDGVRVHPGSDFGVIADRAHVLISHLQHKDRAAAWARRRGKPIVRMAHGSTDDWQETVADLIVFNSESLQKEAEKDKGWTGDSIVVPPPVWAREYYTDPGDEATLVNLSVEKGGEVFWELARRLPQHRFLGVMGGYGYQLGPDGLLGRPKDITLPNASALRPVSNMADNVYARTRVLLMPSLRETYGRTAMEAACSGIPTIAHPTPGLVETLGSSATFVDRDDLDGWVNVVDRLMSDGAAWLAASNLALERAARLTPGLDLDRFVAALERLASP